MEWWNWPIDKLRSDVEWFSDIDKFMKIANADLAEKRSGC